MLIIREELFNDFMCLFFDYLHHFEILLDNCIKGFKRHVLFLFLLDLFESNKSGWYHRLLLRKTIFPWLDLLFIVKFSMNFNAIWTKRLKTVQRSAIVCILLVRMLSALDSWSTWYVHLKSSKIVYSNPYLLLSFNILLKSNCIQINYLFTSISKDLYFIQSTNLSYKSYVLVKKLIYFLIIK